MPVSSTGRRAILRAGCLGLVTAVLAKGRSFAQDGGDPAGRVEAFSHALLAAMRGGRGMSFTQRFAMLAPAVDRALDLDVILRTSVGPQWAGMSADQQAALRQAFRRYTIANFAANFDSYAGETIQVNPEPRSLPNGDEIVTTKIIPTSGSPTTLAYVMRQTPSGWKAVDILADGAISRVATQRSDFRALLARGGGPALVQSLQNKVATLSDNAPV
ncbi:MAG TPA: ABC transporter substrate-binding protein [Acetobacteraceae bacterium]|nr:ABC transporter substrate-binding protein [Acetobacteraceae bacterium]